jgi:hypothetical protein
MNLFQCCTYPDIHFSRSFHPICHSFEFAIAFSSAFIPASTSIYEVVALHISPLSDDCIKVWIRFRIGPSSRNLRLAKSLSICSGRFSVMKCTFVFRTEFQQSKCTGSSSTWLFVNREFSIRDESWNCLIVSEHLLLVVAGHGGTLSDGWLFFTAPNDMYLFSNACVCHRVGQITFTKTNNLLLPSCTAEESVTVFIMLEIMQDVFVIHRLPFVGSLTGQPGCVKARGYRARVRSPTRLLQAFRSDIPRSLPRSLRCARRL